MFTTFTRTRSPYAVKMKFKRLLGKGLFVKFKTYDPEEDGYLHEDFEEVLERPEDVGKFREAIEEALKDAEEVLGFSSDVEIVFGLADPERIKEKWWEDAGTNFHVYGFTYGSWFDDRERDFIFLYANDFKDDWKAALKNMVVHERAHIEFYDHHSDEVLKKRLNNSMYDNILFEGHSTNSAAKLNREKGYGWKPSHRELGKVDPDLERLKEEFEKKRTESGFFDHGGDEWEEAEGYPVSFEIFHWVLENKNLEIQDLPDLSQEKVRELVDEAAEELYS